MSALPRTCQLVFAFQQIPNEESAVMPTRLFVFIKRASLFRLLTRFSGWLPCSSFRAFGQPVWTLSLSLASRVSSLEDTKVTRFKRRGLPPYGLLNSFAPDCRRGRNPPKPARRVCDAWQVWLRFRVTATQWLLWCAGVRPQPEFRRQEADIGSRCKHATIGGKCSPNFQRDSRKFGGYLLGYMYHVP